MVDHTLAWSDTACIHALPSGWALWTFKTIGSAFNQMLFGWDRCYATAMTLSNWMANRFSIGGEWCLPKVFRRSTVVKHNVVGLAGFTEINDETVLTVQWKHSKSRVFYSVTELLQYIIWLKHYIIMHTLRTYFYVHLVGSKSVHCKCVFISPDHQFCLYKTLSSKFKRQTNTA